MDSMFINLEILLKDVRPQDHTTIHSLKLMVDLKMKKDMLVILEMLQLEMMELLIMSLRIHSFNLVENTLSLEDPLLFMLMLMILAKVVMNFLPQLVMLVLDLHVEQLVFLDHSELN